MSLTYVLVIAALAALAALAAGCDKSKSGPSAGAGNGGAPATGGAPAGTNSSQASQASQSKPGYAAGRLTEEGGKVITVPGAKLTVSLWGVSSKSGEKVSYNPKVNPDGTYEQKLVEGSYQFSGARIDVPFNGKHFWFDLEPVGDDHSDRDSDKAIVQDYVWKLHGLRPGQDADEGNFTKWYGGSVNMQFASYREDTHKSVPRPPAGTKVVFTLTPTGKLIDGSDGKPLTFTREFDPLLGGLKNGNLPDVPIADYRVTGEEISPDGSKKPLLIQQAFAKYGDSAEVHFQPGSSTGAWPVNVGFTRRAE